MKLEASWHLICVNFVPHCRDPADQIGGSDIGLQEALTAESENTVKCGVRENEKTGVNDVLGRDLKGQDLEHDRQ